MSTINSKPLWTSLILALIVSACANPAPKPPPLILFQPIINQKLCDNGGHCEVKSFCREFHQLANDDFELFATHPVEKCSGVFGVDVDLLVALKDYVRKVKAWIKDTCQKPETSPERAPNVSNDVKP